MLCGGPKVLAVGLICFASTSYAEGGWLRSTDSDCLIWVANTVNENAAIWTGSCVKGKAAGQGILTLTYREENGNVLTERYEGSMQGGKTHRSGRFSWSTGTIYSGEFSDGMRHGQGLQVWGAGTPWDGNRYEGEFQRNLRTGKGVYVWKDGDRYEGDFQDGEQHGQGKFIPDFPDGKDNC